jgi:hypothetical protein
MPAQRTPRTSAPDRSASRRARVNAPNTSAMTCTPARRAPRRTMQCCTHFSFPPGLAVLPPGPAPGSCPPARVLGPGPRQPIWDPSGGCVVGSWVYLFIRAVFWWGGQRNTATNRQAGQRELTSKSLTTIFDFTLGRYRIWSAESDSNTRVKSTGLPFERMYFYCQQLIPRLAAGLGILADQTPDLLWLAATALPTGSRVLLQHMDVG